MYYNYYKGKSTVFFIILMLGLVVFVSLSSYIGKVFSVSQYNYLVARKKIKKAFLKNRVCYKCFSLLQS